MIENPDLRELIEDFIQKEVEQLIKMQDILSNIQFANFQESEEFKT